MEDLGAAKYRPGSFPHADEANVWGELYLRFATAAAEARLLPIEERGLYCKPLFEACFWWAYDRLLKDEDFMGAYAPYEGVELGVGDMNMVLGWAKAALARANLWGWADVPLLVAPDL